MSASIIKGRGDTRKCTRPPLFFFKLASTTTISLRAGALPRAAIQLRLSGSVKIPLGRHLARVGDLAPLAIAEVDGIALNIRDPNHRGSEAGADLHENLRVVEVGHGTHNGASASLRIVRLEDAAADEDSVHTELHHERGIGWGGNTASGEVDNGELAMVSDPLDQIVRSLHLLRSDKELVLGEDGETLDLSLHQIGRAHV